MFQPAEETADGAQAMIEDGLASIVGDVDVALAQHVLPMPAGHRRHPPGPTLSAADSMRITVHGRGAHGSMPQAAVDPVVLAAMIVVRLQTVVAREVAPGDTAVLTVGSIQAGTKSNVIPDHAVLQLNVRTYDERTRATVLDAIERIVRAECEASRSPQAPEFELFDRYPLTDNDAGGHRPGRAPRSPTSSATRAGELAAAERQRGLQRHPDALGAPYTYWGIGGIDPDDATAPPRRPAASPRTSRSTTPPTFAPVLQPTLDTGTQALVVAALAWLHRSYAHPGPLTHHSADAGPVGDRNRCACVRRRCLAPGQRPDLPRSGRLLSTVGGRRRRGDAFVGEPGSGASPPPFRRVHVPAILKVGPACQLVSETAERAPSRQRPRHSVGEVWLATPATNSSMSRYPAREPSLTTHSQRSPSSRSSSSPSPSSSLRDPVLKHRLGPHLTGVEIDAAAGRDRVSFEHIDELIEIDGQALSATGPAQFPVPPSTQQTRSSSPSQSPLAQIAHTPLSQPRAPPMF